MRIGTALQLALALLLAASPAPAAPFKIRAFGDSITYGDFDTPQGYGYPGRLEDRLLADGWNVDVVNDGVNGEKTSQALSRIDAELAQGGDLFLLMEGTNDIYASISTASIVFNLNELATRAEEAGMPAVHASLIPQYPCATKDASNVKTGALADELEIAAAAVGRDFLPIFDYFLSLPNLYVNYYNDYNPPCDAGEANDPVGHPNASGYSKLTDPFEDLVLGILESGPGLEIVAPESPVAGVEVGFGANLHRTDYTRLDWTFGDGGRQSVTPVAGVAPTAFWIYLEPGTYPVSVTWHRSNGTSGTIESEVVVGGTAPGWTPRVSFVPAAVREGGPWPADLRFGLDLENADSGSGWVARGTLLEEAPPGELIPLTEIVVEPAGPDPEAVLAAIREGVPAPPDTPRLWWIPQAGGVSFSDLISTEFADDDRSAGLLLEIFHGPGASDGDFTVLGRTRRAGQGALGDVIPEIPAAAWNGDARSLPGFETGSDRRILILLTNLGAIDQELTVRLIDGAAAEVAAGTVAVVRGTTFRAELAELFPGIDAFTGPFTVELDASPVPFAAAGLVANAATGTVDYVEAVP